MGAGRPGVRARKNAAMNVDALFDKLLTDLADAGVQEASGSGEPSEPRAPGSKTRTRILTSQGRPFARLRGEQMSFFMPPGTPGLPEALSLQNSMPVGDGSWVDVPADDVSEWESLARCALQGLRDN